MKKSYLILLIGFLLVIIYNEVNNKVLDNTNIVVNYNKYLEDELNTLRNFKVNDNLDLVLTKVKYRNMYGSDLVIYRGFNDLIKKNDAILTNDGLVGIVKKTYNDSSIVDLITSRDSAISVSIGDYFGILKCINNELVITDINNYSNINVGDKIYTSGLGNINKGIYVGVVKSINLTDTGIEKIIYVDIGNRLNNLNYLYIWRSL